MKKILLSILATILSLASGAPSAIAINNKPDTITEQKWQTLAKRYYQSRYRIRFESDNHLLSLREVNNILGLTGRRTKISKKTNTNNSHQYWYWQDPQAPHKKIQAVFVYHQLVSLRSKGFDRQKIEQLKQRIIDRSH